MIGTRQARTLDGIEYAPGARFEVVATGLRLTGWTPMRGGHQGWSQELHPGDIITCTGYGPGWGSDPGYGIEWTTEQSQAAHASHCDLSPSTGGVFAYRPRPGAVRPIP